MHERELHTPPSKEKERSSKAEARVRGKRDTDESDGALGLADRVFGQTLIVAEVVRLQTLDGELHVGAEAVDERLGPHPPVGQQHQVVVDAVAGAVVGAVVGAVPRPHPVGDGPRLGLAVALERDPLAQRRRHQLVRHPHHRRDCAGFPATLDVVTRASHRFPTTETQLGLFIFFPSFYLVLPSFS